jgi:hypothetical protein
VSIAERLFGIALQHSQIAANDGDRGPEFVDGERKQLSIGFRQQNG